jgi:hypothetical protein
MAPTPLPDPAVPIFASSLDGKPLVVTPQTLYLGKNTQVIENANGGIQTNLPFTTSDLIYSQGYRVKPGSQYDYFKSDNFKIDNSGAITSTSTGPNSLAGSLSVSSSVTAGSFSTAGTLNVTGKSSLGSVSSADITSSALVTATNGFSTTSGDFLTSTGKVSAQDLKINSTNLKIDSTSVVNSFMLNGDFKLNANASGSNAFTLDSTTGKISTYGDISTIGSGTITSAGAISGAALNIGKLDVDGSTDSAYVFTVDAYGAMTAKDSNSSTAIYSIDKAGNFFTSGNLTASGSASLASDKFHVDANGNLINCGTINSGSITSTGNAVISGYVNIGGTPGSPAIELSNNGTSYFQNSLQIGAANAKKSILNSDGSVSFATGNFTVDTTGDVVAKGTATFGNNSEVALGFAPGSSNLTNAKVSVDSNGNVSAAGTLAISGDTTLTGSLSVASGNMTVNSSGVITTKAGLSVSNAKFTVDSDGDVVAAGTFSAANNKFTVNANGDVSASGKLDVTGDSTLSGKLAVTGDSTLSGKLAVTGDSTLSGKLEVAGTASVAGGNFTVSSSGYVTTNDGLSLASEKFTMDNNANIISQGSASFANNKIALNSNGSAKFADNQILLNSDGSASFSSSVTSNFGYSNYVLAPCITDKDTSTLELPAYGTPEDAHFFGLDTATTNVLTTQEYVNRAIFHQTLRLNDFFGSGAAETYQTLENFLKLLAQIDGTDAASIIAGLQGDYSNIYKSVASLVNNSYNSVLINCVPAVWGDECPPQPIPTPVTNYYTQDGWFFSNVAATNKINWHLPAYNQMTVSAITNLFMNIYAVSSNALPSISIYTAPKGDSSDLYPGVANAKMTYNFTTSNSSKTALKSLLAYVSSAPGNSFNNASSDQLQCISSQTKNATLSTTTTIINGMRFNQSFDNTIVRPSDVISHFGLETTGLENVKDVMFILQSFCIGTSTGITKLTFKNADVVNNYIMNYFFKTNSDFSKYVENPEPYFSTFNTEIEKQSLVTISNLNDNINLKSLQILETTATGNKTLNLVKYSGIVKLDVGTTSFTINAEANGSTATIRGVINGDDVDITQPINITPDGASVSIDILVSDQDDSEQVYNLTFISVSGPSGVSNPSINAGGYTGPWW